LAYSRGRKVALVIVAGAAALALGPALATGATIDFPSAVHRFSASAPGQVLLAPFQPFGRTFTARSLFPELLGWAAAATAINGLLLALTMWLDANYLEAAAAASRRVYERMQRMRRGFAGGAGAGFGDGPGGGEGDSDAAHAAPSRKKGGALARRFRVPRPPWLGGAGPVAWRQLTTAARRPGGMLLVLAVCAGMCVMFFVTARRGGDVRPAIVSTVAWFTILVTGALKFDFRADLDQVPWLKSLPLRPAALAVGQLATPVLLLFACHGLLFAATAAALPAIRRPLLAAVVLVLPFDVILVAVENLLFLLFPTRGPATPGELGAMGRQVVLFLVKMLLVALACGVAAALAVAALKLTHSALAGVAVAFVALTVEALAFVPLIAAAYDRFDPSTDTPP
jgi:hypothetical protein